MNLFYRTKYISHDLARLTELAGDREIGRRPTAWSKIGFSSESIVMLVLKYPTGLPGILSPRIAYCVVVAGPLAWARGT